MGVKFAREYEDIVKDLTNAIAQIKDCYTFFEMTKEDWDNLNETEQKECIETLSDDVFFALGTNESVAIGTGTLTYDAHKHLIKVDQGENLVTVVHLI